MIFRYLLVLVLNCVVAASWVCHQNRKIFRFPYALLAASMSFWVLSLYNVIEQGSIFWGRMAFVSGILALTGGYLIVRAMYKNFETNFVRRIDGLIWLGTLFFVPVSLLSGGILKRIISTVPIKAEFGPLYFCLFGYCIFLIGLTLTILLVGYRRSQGIDRFHFYWMLVGTGLFYLLAGTTNLILPALGNHKYSALGPQFLLLFLLCDILPPLVLKRYLVRYLVKQTLMNMLSLVVVSGIFLLGVFLYLYSHRTFNYPTFFVYLVISVAVLALFPIVRRIFDDLTDRIIFHRRYDYQTTLKGLTEMLSTLLNLEAIPAVLASTLPVIFETTHLGVFLRDEGSGAMKLVSGNTTVQSMTQDWEIVSALETDPHSIVLADLDVEFRLSRDLAKHRLQKMLDEMKTLAASAVMPLVQSGKLTGFLVLGNRGKNLPFTDEDVDLLETVAHHAGLALQSASRYQDLVSTSKQLNALNTYALKVSSTFELHRIFELTHDMAQDWFRCRGMVLITQGADGIHVRYSDYTKPEEMDPLELVACLETVGSKSGYLHFRESDHRLPDPIAELMNFVGAKSTVALSSDIGEGRGFLLTFFGAEFPEAWGTNQRLLQTFGQVFFSALRNGTLYAAISDLMVYNDEVLKNMVSGVVVINEKLRVTAFNKKAEEIFGLKMWEVIGKDLALLSDKNPALKNLEETIKNGQGKTVELEIQHGDEMRSYSFSTAVIRRGADRGALGILSDISIVKALQKEAEQASRLSSLGTMAAGIAHEIKNPLVAIKTFTQLLPERWREAAFREKYVQVVGPQVDRIDALCKNLLQLRKPAPPVLVTTSLGDIVQDVKKLLELRCPELNIKISTDDTRVDADRVQVLQLVLNLAINAIEAEKPSSKNDVILELNRESNGWLLLRLQDSGVGIAPDLQEKIFDPFYTTKPKGTGLGMSIVHRIVKDHHAKIQINSTVGVGTVVTVLFPPVGSPRTP